MTNFYALVIFNIGVPIVHYILCLFKKIIFIKSAIKVGNRFPYSFLRKKYDYL